MVCLPITGTTRMWIKPPFTHLPTNPKGRPCNSRCGTREEGRKHAYIWSLCCRCVVGIRGDYKLRSFVRAPNGVTPEVSRFKQGRATGERATRMRGFSAMQDILSNWSASCVVIVVCFFPAPYLLCRTMQLHALSYERA